MINFLIRIRTIRIKKENISLLYFLIIINICNRKLNEKLDEIY